MEHRRGDAVLRRRADGAVELRVNGVFVMDDAETASERLLATSVLSQVRQPRRILVGGLGLGHTLRELLADARVQQVTVVELEPALPAWMHENVLPGADLLDDSRVVLHTDDVRRVIDTAGPRAYDAILLDVDNGPDFLVHEQNAGLYEEPFLRRCAAALAAGGRLCVWSMADPPRLRQALATVFDHVETLRVPVRLQGRDESYWLLSGHLTAHPGPGDSLGGSERRARR